MKKLPSTSKNKAVNTAADVIRVIYAVMVGLLFAVIAYILLSAAGVF